MQASPSTNNVRRAIRVPRKLDEKVLKRYRFKGFTIKDAYILALQFATTYVELPSKEYQRIADFVKHNEKKEYKHG